MPNKRTNIRTRTKLNENAYKSDINAINKVRKDMGVRNLPVRKTVWYDRVVEFSKGMYANSEFAAKAISLSISPYQATKLQTMSKAQVKTYLRKIVNKKSFWDTSLDKSIRSNNVQVYGSDAINQASDKGDEDRIKEIKSSTLEWQNYLKNGNLKAL